MSDGKQFSVDELVLALAKLSPEQIKELRQKAGRKISAANMEHLKAIGDCLKGMQDCHKSIADAHEVLAGYTKKAAKLHDDLHDTVVSMMDHGTSLGDHLKALMKSAKPEDDEDDPDDIEDPDNSDRELAARLAEIKAFKKPN